MHKGRNIQNTRAMLTNFVISSIFKTAINLSVLYSPRNTTTNIKAVCSVSLTETRPNIPLVCFHIFFPNVLIKIH